MVGRQPVHARVPTEPGHLAPGELAGGALGVLPSGLLVEVAVEELQHLGIAQRLARGPAFTQPARHEPADLVDQAGRPHRVHPLVQTPIERFAFGAQADLDRGAQIAGLGQRRDEWAPGDLDDLQRPHDAPPVAGQDALGGDRIEFGEPGMQGVRADLLDLGLQPGPDRRFGAREVQVVEHRAHVQAGATDQHGRLAGRQQLVDHTAGQALVDRHRRGLGDLPEVEQVVRDPAALGRCELGRSDVHAPVELHGVGVHHLASEPAGQFDTERGLAGRGGTDDGDHERCRSSRHADSVPGVTPGFPRPGRGRGSGTETDREALWASSTS